MTEDQRKQFDLYGCASRCVLELARLEGKSISIDDFFTKFEPDCPQWEQNPGLIGCSIIIDMMRELELAWFAECFRSYTRAMQNANDPRFKALFVFLELDWDHAMDEIGHTCLIKGYHPTERNWTIWNPRLPNGESGIATVTTEFLEARRAFFLVLA